MMRCFGISACRYAVLAIAASSWVIGHPTWAVIRTWSSTNSGTFTDLGNWAPNDAYPGPGDTAEFTSGTVAYTVTLPGSFILDPPRNYVVDKLIVRTNEVTLTDNRSRFIDAPSLTVANPDESIVIGQAAGEVAILNTTLHKLTAANLGIGYSSPFDAGATGTLNVNAGSVEIAGEISIGPGFQDKGTLNVRNGGRVSTNLLTVGNPSGTVGRGALLIEAGGSVVSSDARLGFAITTDTVKVTGAGSKWTNNHVLNVSNFGALTVQDGGALVTADAQIRSPFIESTPIVRITGAGSTWTNSGDIRIGGFDAFGTKYGNLVVSDGAIVTVGGRLYVEASAKPTDFGSALFGNGTIEGIVNNDGYVQPGLRTGISGPYVPATLHIDGSYLQSVSGTLGIGVGGTAPGTQYDQLKVNGAVALDGILLVGLNNSFQPSAGDQFKLLDWTSRTGVFLGLQLPSLATGLRWDISQLYASGVLSVVAGFDADFEEDLDVDGQDLVRWRQFFGNANVIHAEGDADHDRDADGTDFLRWQRQLGSSVAASANHSVPEPDSFVLSVCGTVLLYRRLRGASGSCTRRG